MKKIIATLASALLVSTAFAQAATPASATTETGKAQLKANHKKADAQKTANEKRAAASQDAMKAQESANEDKASVQADADKDAAKVARADTPKEASSARVDVCATSDTTSGKVGPSVSMKRALAPTATRSRSASAT